MKKTQSGFSTVEGLLIVLVLALVGASGRYIMSRGNTATQSSSSTANTYTWKTVHQKGITVTYPKAWDKVKASERLHIGGKADANFVGVGFGAPYGYKYANGTWTYVDMNGNKVDGSQPLAAPANVRYADSTVLLADKLYLPIRAACIPSVYRGNAKKKLLATLVYLEN